MSHGITEHDDAILKNDAWHRLGLVWGDNFTWEDARAAGQPITFPVEKLPLSELILVHESHEDEFATVRFAPDGSSLVLKAGLGVQATVFHAEEAYAFGQCIRDQYDGKADLVSAATIRGGRQWFMTYDLGDFSIGDYAVKDYLSLSGSYDGSWKFQANNSGTIAVCANTIAVARAGQRHYSFKHTSGIKDRVEAAKAALRTSRDARDGFIRLGNQLLTQKVSPAEYGRLVKALFPIEDDTPTKTRNVHDEAIQSVTTLYRASGGEGVNLVSESGNAWAFVQAVNTYENWGQPIRKTKGQSEADTRALRQLDAVIGGGQPLSEKAIDLVLALN